MARATRNTQTEEKIEEQTENQTEEHTQPLTQDEEVKEEVKEVPVQKQSKPSALKAGQFLFKVDPKYEERYQFELKNELQPNRHGFKDQIIPKYAHLGKNGDHGLDFYAQEDMRIQPGKTAKVPLGIAMELPEGWYLELHNKSGPSTNLTVHLINCVGHIDNGYRDFITAPIYNASSKVVWIRQGQPIVQGIFKEYTQWSGTCVDELTETDRGTKGYGSTQKA